MPPALSLSVHLDCPTLDTSAPSPRLMELVVTAAHAFDTARRAPLHLSLVLDRSCSMSGDKLRFTQIAACHVLDGLNEADRVALIAYDDEVRVLSEAVAVTNEARERLKASIQALRTGGSTDLCAGWLSGAAAIAAHADSSAVTRVLLLTDGLANRGETNPETLAVHARELRNRSVTLSTFGVGYGYDEHLLTALAENGGGRCHFIGSAADIPACFAEELGELLATIARESVVDIAVPSGVSAEVLGDLPHDRTEARLRLLLGDIFGGRRQVRYINLLCSPAPAGSELTLPVTLSWADLDAQPQTVNVSVAFSYVADAAQSVVDKEVRARAADVDMAAHSSRALRMERAGDARGAAKIMRRALALARPALPAEVADDYEIQAYLMKQGLSEPQRKQAQETAYRKRNTRT